MHETESTNLFERIFAKLDKHRYSLTEIYDYVGAIDKLPLRARTDPDSKDGWAKFQEIIGNLDNTFPISKGGKSLSEILDGAVGDLVCWENEISLAIGFVAGMRAAGASRQQMATAFRAWKI